mmetsp:Transcript_22617/g.57916  ORF Transcript_22617/g.57916 Transcript_22617/m.57916 type:complete len:244 (-) Transcript_22617:2458-3189(-)
MPTAMPAMVRRMTSFSSGFSGSSRRRLIISTCSMLSGVMEGSLISSMRRRDGLCSHRRWWPVIARKAFTESSNREWRLCPSAISSASVTRTLSYRLATGMLALARFISTKSMVLWKNGQCAYIWCSSGREPLSAAHSKASFMPSHTGRFMRVWVQAKIQGMARSCVTPPLALRREGRLPMLRPPRCSWGVALAKYLMNVGSLNTTWRYASQLTSPMVSISVRHGWSGGGAAGGMRVQDRMAVV